MGSRRRWPSSAAGSRSSVTQSTSSAGLTSPKLVKREIRLSAFALFWPRFRRNIHPYDVVNVHGPVPTISEVFLLLVKTLHHMHRPAIVYTHHSDLAIPRLERWCGLYNKLTGRIAHTADVVVVSSAAYQNKLRRLQGSPVELVPWGIEARGKVQPRPAHDGKVLRVLFVGQLRPYKGVPVLIEAAAGMSNVEVTIVGSGSGRVAFEEQARSLRADNVHFRGRVSDAELWEAYSRHDIVVLPSTTTAEAYGLVLAEGMVAGCIPVASDLPGVREVVGAAGLLVEPGSVESLRMVLTRLQADDELRLRFAAQTALHSRDLSVQRTAERYERVFEHAVDAVTDRLAAVAVPAQWADPEALLAEIASSLGIQRVSLSLLAGGRILTPARVWRHGSHSFKVDEAPIAVYAAQKNEPVVIGAGGESDADLERLLLRPELTSALLVPVRWSRGTVSVIGMATGPEDMGRRLGPDDLAVAIDLLYPGIAQLDPATPRMNPAAVTAA